MERNQFSRFSDALKCLGDAGVGTPEFLLGRENKYELQYIPFEHVNRQAKLLIVGITPGNNQLTLAYERARELLMAGKPVNEILVEVKKAGAFGGPAMKPNLLRMLRHFHFERLLGITDVESLWDENAHLLHSTSVIPHAAFKAGDMFAGSFKEVMDSPLLAECFTDCFVPSVREVSAEALFVGLGPCPQAALEWCVQEGLLQRRQVLGAFCHPSSSGGSTTRYYLREVKREELDPKDPVLRRCDWLDQAYEQMKRATALRLGGYGPSEPAPLRPFTHPASTKAKKQRKSQVKNPETKSGNGIDAAAPDDHAVQLVSEILNAGYRLTRETKKLSEFESPTDQVIYLVKTTSRLNSINLMVHPRLDPGMLRRLDGVAAISPEHRFHSNMTRFPKRINNGAIETAYGWQINVDTVGNLPKFLEAFVRTTSDS